MSTGSAADEAEGASMAKADSMLPIQDRTFIFKIYLPLVLMNPASHVFVAFPLPAA
jgi:hypothetical protein